jgi:hypothetical protein
LPVARWLTFRDVTIEQGEGAVGRRIRRVEQAPDATGGHTWRFLSWDDHTSVLTIVGKAVSGI